MAANNESIKTKKSESVRGKSTGRSLAKATSVETQPESQPRMALEDKKSLRAISSLTGYLGIAVLLNVLMLIIQLWATFKAGYVLTSFSFVYLFLSLASIAALVWCIILLNRKNVLALWAFVGFITLSFLNTLTLRLYGGKALFVALDLVAYIVQAAILLSIYSLKRKDILRRVE